MRISISTVTQGKHNTLLKIDFKNKLQKYLLKLFNTRKVIDNIPNNRLPGNIIPDRWNY